MQIMKNASESSALPGPMNCSHHPGARLSGVDAAWDDADKPVCNRITLSFFAESFPHVSYAISKAGKGVDG